MPLTSASVAGTPSAGGWKLRRSFRSPHPTRRTPRNRTAASDLRCATALSCTTMKKSELVDQVAKGAGVAKRQTEKVLDAFFETAKKAAKKGDEVSWPKFGVVEAAKKAGKTAGKKAGKLASSKKGAAKQAVTKVVEKVDKVVHVPGLRPDEPPAAEPATAEPGDRRSGDRRPGDRPSGHRARGARRAAGRFRIGCRRRPGGARGGRDSRGRRSRDGRGSGPEGPRQEAARQEGAPDRVGDQGPHGQEVARRPKVPGQEGRRHRPFASPPRRWPSPPRRWPTPPRPWSTPPRRWPTPRTPRFRTPSPTPHHPRGVPRPIDRRTLRKRQAVSGSSGGEPTSIVPSRRTLNLQK